MLPCMYNNPYGYLYCTYVHMYVRIIIIIIHNNTSQVHQQPMFSFQPTAIHFFKRQQVSSAWLLLFVSVFPCFRCCVCVCPGLSEAGTVILQHNYPHFVLPISFNQLTQYPHQSCILLNLYLYASFSFHICTDTEWLHLCLE